jgi:hypothetical protein
MRNQAGALSPIDRFAHRNQPFNRLAGELMALAPKGERTLGAVTHRHPPHPGCTALKRNAAPRTGQLPGSLCVVFSEIELKNGDF